MEGTESVETPTTIAAENDGRSQAVLEFAEKAFLAQPHWVAFYRNILGAEGAIRRTFPTAEELNRFEKSEEHAAIQQMLAKLREKQTVDSPELDREPTKVITVRLPKSLHEALKGEAHLHQTSMNQLCISKLVQLIDKGLVPGE